MQIQAKYHLSICSIIISVYLPFTASIVEYKRLINQLISIYTIFLKNFNFMFDRYYFTAKSGIRSRTPDLPHLRPSRSSLAVTETRDEVNTKPASRRLRATLDLRPEMAHSARTAGTYDTRPRRWTEREVFGSSRPHSPGWRWPCRRKRGAKQSAISISLPTGRFNVPARRDKLRSFDSRSDIFDSKRWSFDSRPPFVPRQLISTRLNVPAIDLKLRSFDSEPQKNDS